jgi:hypothetical protein
MGRFVLGVWFTVLVGALIRNTLVGETVYVMALALLLAVTCFLTGIGVGIDEIQKSIAVEEKEREDASKKAVQII